jgi:CxxC motif-containing protein
MEDSKKGSIKAPVKMGQVVVENILDTNTNIIITRN